MPGSGKPVPTSSLPHCPTPPGLPESSSSFSSVNDGPWSPTSRPHLGVSPCSPFLPRLRLVGKRAPGFFFNWLHHCCCSSGSGLYRRRTQPLPTPGVSFQATQDIFSFCCPCSVFLNLLSPPRGTPVGGVLRFPYGDSSTFEVSVLGNICGLQGPSQVWGSPSPYDQYWGVPWEPRSFEAPALLFRTLDWVFPVFIEIKFHLLRVAWLIPR